MKRAKSIVLASVLILFATVFQHQRWRGFVQNKGIHRMSVWRYAVGRPGYHLPIAFAFN